MSTRVELEAVLASAEADWRGAKGEMDQALANLAKANANWDRVVADRRKAGTDRRKAGAVWDQQFADRRKADSDRRIPEADIRALSKAVAERHHAYLAQSKAEAACADAMNRLNAAAEARSKAIAALDALDCIRQHAVS